MQWENGKHLDAWLDLKAGHSQVEVAGVDATVHAANVSVASVVACRIDQTATHAVDSNAADSAHPDSK